MAETATLDKPKTAAPKKSTARNRAEGVTTTLTPLQEAQEAVKRYSELSKQVAQAKKDMADKTVPLLAEMETLKAKLEVLSLGKLKATFGAAKTMKVEGGVIGWKLGDKTLKMPEFEDKKKAEKSAATFLSIVEKHLPDAIEKQVDKKAVVKAWDSTPKMAAALLKQGFSTDQKDNFFVTAAKL